VVGPSTGGSWRHGTNFIVYTKPGAPTTATSSNITSSNVDLAWTGGGPEYKVVYKTGAVAPANDTDGTQITLGAVNSTTVSGLTASTQYTFAVFSKLTGQTVFSTNKASTTATTIGLPAATRYVNAGTGVNTGGCNVQANPCKTITYAMGQATAGNPGDIVSVAPGTYNLALGEVFPITFKSGVQLIATGNPSNTIIDAAGDTVKQGVISSSGNASNAARIEGFTITNGLNLAPALGVALGGGLRIQSATQTFTVTRNVFSNNEARGYSGPTNLNQTGGLAWGGGIYVFSSPVSISNNVFSGNIARGGNGFDHFGTPLSGNENAGPGEGGAIYVGGTGIIVNNTFYGNAAIGGNGGGSSTGSGGAGQGNYGAISATGNPAPSVANNIFFSNSATTGTGVAPNPQSTAGALLAGNAPSINNNLFFGNTVNGAASTGDSLGTAIVTLNPLFHGAPGNLRIRNTSPAKGAGSATGAPTLDYDGTTRPNPPSIGAFESSLIATTTGLVSSGSPSTQGQSVTFTATMPGAPTGTVTFLDGASTLCAAVAPVAGVAQCVTTGLSVGSHSITASFTGTGDYGSSTSAVVTQAVLALNPPRLANISTRGQVLTNNDRMIAGFIIGGSASKTVVVNVAGPNLVQYGIANALPNPKLTLVRSSDQVVIASNDDWQTQTNPADVAALQAAGFQPNNAAEPAIIATLAPGAYTAIVEGNPFTGVGLVGVFEVDRADVPLINISTRGQVQTGNDVMIAGFIIHGNGSQKVVINVAGPSLNQYGLPGLANPTITLVRSSDNTIIGTNDNWQTQTNPGDVALITAAGFQPNDPLEPALIATLPNGAYTVVVSGVNNTTGVGLVGVFAAP
jgi:hypothetical protein